jgi:hypothetical protein
MNFGSNDFIAPQQKNRAFAMSQSRTAHCALQYSTFVQTLLGALFRIASTMQLAR